MAERDGSCGGVWWQWAMAGAMRAVAAANGSGNSTGDQGREKKDKQLACIRNGDNIDLQGRSGARNVATLT